MRQCSRQVPAAAIFTAAVLVLAACSSQDSPNEPEPTESGPAVSAEIEASFSVGLPGTGGHHAEWEGLVAEYTVTNTSDTDILVAESVDGLQSEGAVRGVDDESAWLTMSDADVLRFSKEIFDVDHGEDVAYQPYETHAARITPGETLTGRAYAPFPLQYAGPQQGSIFEFDGPFDLNEGARQVEICIQIALANTSYDVIQDHTAGRVLVCSDTTELPDQVWEPVG